MTSNGRIRAQANVRRNQRFSVYYCSYATHDRVGELIGRDLTAEDVSALLRETAGDPMLDRGYFRTERVSRARA